MALYIYRGSPLSKIIKKMVWHNLLSCHTHKWSSFLLWSYYQFWSCGLTVVFILIDFFYCVFFLFFKHNYPFILLCSCLFLSFSSFIYRINNDTYISLSHGIIASISDSEYLWCCISAKFVSKIASRLLWERPIRKNLVTRWR